ncbi:S1C family serine protease [Oecophyllibacter saccharovorans]|nr:trypsin-like peptidase domain-containing protein [Oecophyllibacter saccharovorans]
MKPAILTGLVAASTGIVTAGLVCLGFYWFAPVYSLEEQEAGSLPASMHGRAKSVSPPLVLPSQGSSQPSATAEKADQAPLLVDLPSFSPLVRRVIPAVVNISLVDNEPPPTPARNGRTPGTSRSQGHGRSSAQGTTGNESAPSDDDISGAEETQASSRGTPHASTGPTPHGKGAAAGRSHHGRNSRTGLRHERPHAKTPHSAVPHGHSAARRSGAANRPVRRQVRPVEDDTNGAGSGFLIDPSGIIVTNRHVVGEAAHVSVALSDGRILKAHLLGADPMTDIAVIKVNSDTPLPYVTWGDSRLVEIGDWIMVAGNPFGFGSSVTAGIVSAVGRDLGIGALDNFMQLDAPINPGNSGGPAFNLRGEVVAVNAAIASPSDGSVGIGFGIPAEIVAGVVNDIIRTGHVDHGWLGVTLNDATTPMWVEELDPHGAAWKGGLRKGDEILAMGDVPVHDARTVLRSVAAAHPGTVFNFTIRRDGAIRTLAIRLGKYPLSDLGE